MSSVELDQLQQDAVEWLSSRRRAILADEPGVGKTYPALLAARQAPAPRLVLAPAYLIWQLAEELTVLGEEDVDVVHGTPKKREALLAEDGADWRVASYGALASKKYGHLVRDRVWGAVVMDEAHLLRGRKSARTRAAMALRAERIYMMTGTPIVRGPADLWPLLRICGLGGAYWTWAKHWLECDWGPFGMEVGGVRPERLPEWEVMLSRAMLRRPPPPGVLPSVDFRDVAAPAGARLVARHEKARKTYTLGDRIFDSAGALMPVLRIEIALSSAKLKALKEWRADQVGRLVVFCLYRESARGVAEALGTPHVVTGELDGPGRDAVVAAWKQEANAALVATSGSLGTGYDGLQDAAAMCLYERSHLAAENQQTVARVARRGRVGGVSVYAPFLVGTIDARVRRVALERRNISAAALAKEWVEG